MSRVSSPFAVLAAILALGLFSCKRDNRKTDDNPEIPQELIDRGNLYCQLSEPTYQAQRYVVGKCDGAGFTSLHSARCGYVELHVFDGANGKPYRSPTHDCFSTLSSKSEYSRDMLLMRMTAAWIHKDVTWVNRFISYAEPKSWVMCSAIDDATTIGRCVVSPSLINLLFDMQERLEGKALMFTGRESDDAVNLRYDFEAHLDVLRIWLEGQVYGGITDGQLTRLKGYAERENRNALFLAVAARYGIGSMAQVWELLAKFPADRLPGSQDYCTEYLYQRAQDKPGDLEPCPDEGETFSGTDYNFALYVATAE